LTRIHDDKNPMLLIIDNYDSFVHNLARYFQQLGAETLVLRNDAITAPSVRMMKPQAIIFSPGPGTPADAGNSLDLVRSLYRDFPMLGVCLGHQTLAEAFGGRIIRAHEPVHGRSSLVHHQHMGIFAELPSPMRVGRYHSLVVDPTQLPDSLQPTAWTTDGTMMAMEHRELPVIGLQFHPESILTEYGYAMLAAFLNRAGLPALSPLPGVEPAGQIVKPSSDWPTQPITF
jgi:anthranilate synthase/aminodeoxychorismate synthase-like glutamine amidotransferase